MEDRYTSSYKKSVILYKKIKRKKGSFVMWKVLLVFGMPLLIPFEIIYALLVKLGMPDFLGIMQK